MDNPFVIIFLLQLFIAGVLVLVFKGALDRLLIEAALEHLSRMEGAETQEVPAQVVVVTAQEAPVALRERVQAVAPGQTAAVTYRMAPTIGGGVVIQWGDEVLDFSMKSRLKYLFNSQPYDDANNI
jgi:F0F1-type ATP synthase delta subunit